MELARLANGEIDINAIPLDDPETFAEMQKGHTIGVFQLESGPMRELMIEMKPDCMEDIMALIALYRPGPMQSGMDKAYVRRKNGKEPVRVHHPLLEPILEGTYGLMIYQESMLEVLKVIAGMDIAEADLVRKACGKKDPVAIRKYRKAFVDGCAKTNGIGEPLANKMYDEIERFGEYAFSANHSLSYSYLSYQTMFLKTHFPTEYMSALLSSVAGAGQTLKKRLPLYLTEARRLGLKVVTPSIARSNPLFTIESDTMLRFGLNGIESMGPNTIATVLAHRRDEPSKTVYEFMRQTSPDVLKSNSLKNLINSGSMDDLVYLDHQLEFNHDQMLEMLVAEQKALGGFLTKHPLEGLDYLLQSLSTHTVEQLEYTAADTVVEVAGIISQVEDKKTKRGQMMYILGFEDLSGIVETVVFPNMATKYKDEFNRGDIVVIKGKVSHEDDGEQTLSTSLVFFEMTRPEIPDEIWTAPIVLKPHKMLTELQINKMLSLIEKNPGESPVFLEVQEGPHTVVLQFKGRVNESLSEDLKMLGEYTT